MKITHEMFLKEKEIFNSNSVGLLFLIVKYRDNKHIDIDPKIWESLQDSQAGKDFILRFPINETSLRPVLYEACKQVFSTSFSNNELRMYLEKIGIDGEISFFLMNLCLEKNKKQIPAEA